MQLVYTVSTWSGPRWAHAESFIRDWAWQCGLECEVTCEAGWFRERGRFTVRGDTADVQRFIQLWADAAASYNQ